MSERRAAIKIGLAYPLLSTQIAHYPIFGVFPAFWLGISLYSSVSPCFSQFGFLDLDNKVIPVDNGGVFEPAGIFACTAEACCVSLISWFESSVILENDTHF